MSDKETIAKLQEALESAKEKLQEQNEMLKDLISPPYAQAVVTGITKIRNKGKFGLPESMISLTGGTHQEKPKGLKVEVGDLVLVQPKSGGIVAVLDSPKSGTMGTVIEIISDDEVEVEAGGDHNIVSVGLFKGKLEQGDKVMLDTSGETVMKHFGQAQKRFRFSLTTGIGWDDIGGLVEAKVQMKEAVELPYKNPAVFKHYGKKPIKGILLWGPPGCGKTMLGKASATALSLMHKAEQNATGFIYVKGPELLEQYVGAAEATIRALFRRARKHKATHGYPAVMFIDEADAILSKRGTGISSDMEKTIVPMFLTEMDGMEESGALVILATNRADMLDPAIVRDGRIDRKIKVDRPTSESTVEILHRCLKPIPLSNGTTHKQLAEATCKEIFDPRHRMYEITVKDKHVIYFTLKDIINGAMVVSVVDHATSLAMHRDLNSSEKKMGGLGKDDLISAVDAVYRENITLNHREELADYVREFKDDITGLKQIRLER